MQNVSVTGRSPSQDYYMVSPQVHSPHCLTVLYINTLVYRFALAIFLPPLFFFFSLTHAVYLPNNFFTCFSSFITNFLTPTKIRITYFLPHLLWIFCNTLFFTSIGKLIMSRRRVQHSTFKPFYFSHMSLKPELDR